MSKVKVDDKYCTECSQLLTDCDGVLFLGLWFCGVQFERDENDCVVELKEVI